MIEPTYKFYGKTTFPLRQEVQDLLQHRSIRVGQEFNYGWKIDISQTDGICAEMVPGFGALDVLVWQRRHFDVYARPPSSRYLRRVASPNWILDGLQSYAKTFNAISSGDERWVCTVLEDTAETLRFERVQETPSHP